jgi:hypothetical protein
MMWGALPEQNSHWMTRPQNSNQAVPGTEQSPYTATSLQLVQKTGQMAVAQITVNHITHILVTAAQHDMLFRLNRVPAATYCGCCPPCACAASGGLCAVLLLSCINSPRSDSSASS